MSTGFVIGGRRASQIGVGADAYDDSFQVKKDRPNTREEIDAFQRYLCFGAGLMLCSVIPHGYRLTYLYAVTAVLWIQSLMRGNCTFHLTLTTMGGLGHSAVHNYWPFLNETIEGFDARYSAFPDVFFHMTMLVFVWVSMKAFLHPTVNKWTLFCIVGAIVNCCLTNYKSMAGVHYLLFNSTSVFQAVSTAFWIAAVMHYGEWDKKSYAKCLGLVNFVIVSNWGFYECDHWGHLGLGLVGLSMKYRYIEGLFIVCTWVPLVLFKPQQPVKEKSK